VHLEDVDSSSDWVFNDEFFSMLMSVAATSTEAATISGTGGEMVVWQQKILSNTISIIILSMNRITDDS
jgi:hypothetical protein